MAAAANMATEPRTVIINFPSEILAQIMKIACTDRTSMCNARVLILLTWVCQRWREVALGNPLLWTNIYMTKDLYFVNLFLERSHNLPLRVHAHKQVSPPIQQMFMDLVLPHMNRIREMEVVDVEHIITFSHHAISAPPSRANSIPVPFILRKLDVSRTVPHCSDWFLIRSAGLFPPITMIEQSAIAWTLPWFSPQLEEFSFMNAQHLESSLYNIRAYHWLDVLSRVPSLRVLRLGGCIHFECIKLVDDYSSRGFVRLDHLESLVLEGPLAQCIWLVEHLIFPPRATILVEALRGPSVYEIAAMMNLVGKKLYGGMGGSLPNTHVLHMLSFVFEETDGVSLRIQGWGKRPSNWSLVGPGEDDEDPLFQVAVDELTINTMTPIQDYLHRILFMMEQAVPLADVQTLALATYCDFDCEFIESVNILTLPAFIRLLPNLQRLELYGWPEEASLEVGLSEGFGTTSRSNAVPHLDVAYLPYDRPIIRVPNEHTGRC